MEKCLNLMGTPKALILHQDELAIHLNLVK